MNKLTKPKTLRIAFAAVALGTLALAGCSAAPSAVGTWGSSAAQGEPSLTLGADGALSGTDGCNRLMGSYTESNGEVAFKQVASTKMFCEGVDTWLSRLNTAQVSGDTLIVLDESGAEIGTLKRAQA